MLRRNFKGAVCGLNACGKLSSRLFVFPLKLRFVKGMASCAYEKAVAALNGLQSNAAYLKKARLERSSKADKNLIDMNRHLQTLNILPQEIDSINIIHVAGTKGKGSTCAFVESILRNHSYKTGFYSSPHLISVNERIRINGTPISKDKFATYFWEVYSSIQSSLKEDESMPSYFLFLTLMAFYVFVKEQVQAAVIEVGIGGLYDCTNIVRKPVAVGITTLGIDHVNLLGTTITEIAEQKAGIFKPGVPAFTVPQSESAMNVLRKKAQLKKCPLFLSPPLETYGNKISLGVHGLVQNVNASLALQLTHCWLTAQKHNGHISKDTSTLSYENHFLNGEFYTSLSIADTFPLNPETQSALENCIWPGRFQTVQKNKVTFYLDGAHTAQSMKYCGRWFDDLSRNHAAKYQSSVLKVLLFNCTGERKAESLLDPLININFDVVLFSPNKIAVIKDASSDLTNFMVEPEQEMQQCITNKEVWCHLIRSLYENQLSMTSNNGNSSVSASSEIAMQCNNTIIFPSISDALNLVTSGDVQGSVSYNNKTNELTELVNQASQIQILVTGSLHLVGGVLSLIQP